VKHALYLIRKSVRKRELGIIKGRNGQASVLLGRSIGRTINLRKANLEEA
jgi:hypothetical protein